jgi:hypothetical protein
LITVELFQSPDSRVLGEADLVGHRGPCLGEALVRLASEQKRIGLEDLVELELVAFRAALELKRPATAVETFCSAGVFHHSVQGHEFGDDDSSHVLAPF